jgi:hypothetical protein
MPPLTTQYKWNDYISINYPSGSKWPSDYKNSTWCGANGHVTCLQPNGNSYNYSQTVEFFGWVVDTNQDTIDKIDSGNNSSGQNDNFIVVFYDGAGHNHDGSKGNKVGTYTGNGSFLADPYESNQGGSWPLVSESVSPLSMSPLSVSPQSVSAQCGPSGGNPKYWLMGPGGYDPVPGENYTKVKGHGYLYPQISLNLKNYSPSNTTWGKWHACVFEANDTNIPGTYPGDLVPGAGLSSFCGTGDNKYLAECPFIVTDSVPEFPAASVPVAVVGLCAGIYVWLRKRRETAAAA